MFASQVRFLNNGINFIQKFANYNITCKVIFYIQEMMKQSVNLLDEFRFSFFQFNVHFALTVTTRKTSQDAH